MASESLQRDRDRDRSLSAGQVIHKVNKELNAGIITAEEAEATLMHYGIKGMKWGVRREVGPDGLVGSGGTSVTKKDINAGASILSGRAHRKTSKAINGEINADIKSLQKTKYSGKGSIEANRNNYLKDVEKIILSKAEEYNRSPDRRIKTSKTGNYQVESSFDPETRRMSLYVYQLMGDSSGGTYRSHSPDTFNKQFTDLARAEVKRRGDSLTTASVGLVSPILLYSALQQKRNLKHSESELSDILLDYSFKDDWTINDIEMQVPEDFSPDEEFIEQSSTSTEDFLAHYGIFDDSKKDEAVGDFLAHYGIKGMKWGVRRPVGKDGLVGSGRGPKKRMDPADNKFIKRAEERSKYLRVGDGDQFGLHNQLEKDISDTAAGNMGSVEAALNKKYLAPLPPVDKYYDLSHKDRKAYDKALNDYYDDWGKGFAKELEKVAASMGPSPSGKLTYTVVRVDDDLNNLDGFKVYPKQIIKHDEDWIFHKVELDARGRIIKVTPQFDYIEHKTNEFLAHYGVKGMRWGIRRPTGPDGLINSSKSKKKGSTVVRGTKAVGRGTISVARKARDANRARKARKREKYIDEANIKKLKMKSLTDQELSRVVQRLNLEKQYKSLTTPTTPKEKEKAKKADGFITSLAKQQAKRQANNAINAILDPLVKEAATRHRKKS